MFERVQVTDADRRNLVLVAGAMTIIMFVMADVQSFPLRVVAGLIGGLISGTVFLLTTVAMNEIKTRYL